jgi:hypothetical protein
MSTKNNLTASRLLANNEYEENNKFYFKLNNFYLRENLIDTNSALCERHTKESKSLTYTHRFDLLKRI